MKELDDELYWNEGTTSYGRVKKTFGNYELFQDVETILDWGCSKGETTQEIVENSKSKVYGIDRFLDIPKISRMNVRYGDRLKLFCGDGFRYFQEKDVKFDLVLAMNNLLYIMDEQNQEGITNSLGKLVRDEGRLVFGATFGKWSFDENKKGTYVILDKKDDSLKLKSFQRCDLVKSRYISDIITGDIFARHSDIFEVARKNIDFLVEKYA